MYVVELIRVDTRQPSGNPLPGYNYGSAKLGRQRAYMPYALCSNILFLTRQIEYYKHMDISHKVTLRY